MRALIRRMTSLRVSILLIVLTCWLVPTLLLGSFMGGRFAWALREKTEALLATTAQQAGVRVKENVDAVVAMAKDVVYDDELAAAVSLFENGELTYERYFSRCRSYLEHKFGRERLLDFALFFRLAAPQTLFFTTDDYEQAVAFQQKTQQAVLLMSGGLDTGTCFFDGEGQLYLVRNLYNTQMQKYGMLVLGLNEPQLFLPAAEACRDMGLTYMLRLDQYVRGDSRFQALSAGLCESGQTLLYTLEQNTREYDFQFQIQADKHAVYHEMEALQRLLRCLLLLLLPIGGWMLWFISSRIGRPVRLLSEASARISAGELGVTVPLHGNDELCRLAEAFSGMSMRLKKLVDQSYKGQIALRDARIQALQSRVNSHFLNNALETINWQARMEGSQPISEMVEALSLLLNAAMDRSERHLVPLREEVKVAEAYFYFIGLRFGSRLTVQRHIDGALSEWPVPRLAIQTLLENAIEHGIAPAGGGHIELSVFSGGEKLTVEVLNSGKKLTEDDLLCIRRLMNDGEDPEGHMGIRNVARRLRLLYGFEAAMRIDTDECGQTRAAFTIPLRQGAAGPKKEKGENA